MHKLTARQSDHTFLPRLLTEKSVVLDCGANRGAYARWIADNICCRIYAFEPDPRLCKALPTLPRTEMVEAAVMPAAGLARLHIGDKQDSSALFSEGGQCLDVVALNLEEFCHSRSLTGIDLIKMDIEGAEIDVLNGLSAEFLQKVTQMTVEFHDFIVPEDRPKIEQCLQRLARLGFYALKASRTDYSDILLINTSRIRLSWAMRIWLKCEAYWGRGACRAFTRMFR